MSCECKNNHAKYLLSNFTDKIIFNGISYNSYHNRVSYSGSIKSTFLQDIKGKILYFSIYSCNT